MEELKRQREESDKKFSQLVDGLRKQREESDKRFDESNKRIQEIIREIKELGTKIEEDRMEIKSTITRYSMSLEDKAKIALEWKLGYNVNISRLEIPFVVEVDLFATFDKYVLVGEVKVVAGPSAVQQLEKAIQTIKQNRPELFKGKIIIPIIFTMRPKYIEKECKEKGIFLTDGYNDYTELKEIMKINS